MKTNNLKIKPAVRVFFLITISIGLVAITTKTSQAQGNNGYVPMWEIYGINPYHPHTTPTQRFSPMQTYPMARTYGPSGCVGQNLIPGQVVCPQPVLENSIVVPGVEGVPFTNEIGGIVAPDSPATNASPSDIIIEAGNSSDPTPISKSVLENENSPVALAEPISEPNQELEKRLEAAEAELENAKSRLEAATNKARSASERAYAAEKASDAAVEYAKRQLDDSGKEKQRLEKALVKAKQSAESALEKSEGIVKRLNQQKAQLEKEIAAASKAVETGKTENKRRDQKQEALRARIDNLIAEQKKTSRDASKAVAKLRRDTGNRLRELMEEKAQFGKSNEAAKSLAAKAKAKIKGQDERLAELENQLEKANAERAEAMQQSKKKTADLNAAMTSASDADALADKLKALEKEKTTLKEMAAKAIANVSKARNEAKLKDNQLSELESLIQESKSTQEQLRIKQAQSEDAFKSALNDSAAKQDKLNQRVAELETQRDSAVAELETVRQAAQAKTKNASKSPTRKSDAQTMVDQLIASAGQADAIERTRGKTRKPRNKKNAEEKKPEDKADDEKSKSKRKKFDAEEQIKKLNESMERQINKSSKLIKERGQARIDQLLKDGKDESNSAVKKIRENLENDLEANESKIRTRIDERIKRIRKEQAARDRS